MKSRLQRNIFSCIILAIVILLFTAIDYFIHGLEKSWSVPEYYFRNKIPFGFLWGIIGLLIATKIKGVWLKSLVVAGIIAVSYTHLTLPTNREV